MNNYLIIITKIFFILIIILIIIKLLILLIKNNCSSRARFERSSNKKEQYKVIKDHNDLILEQNKRLISLLYPNLYNLDIKPMYDCVPEDSNTYDKKKIEVCVKNKKGQYLPNDKIRHILLHEIAHYTSPKTDKEHKTKEFIDGYNKLMKQAIASGILNMNNLAAAK